jgi:hypothetical protein
MDYGYGRGFRQGCFTYMGDIADVAGANLNEPVPLTSDKPAETGPIRRWNDPRMSQKRKKLLAVLGNWLPQAYWPEPEKASGSAPDFRGGGLWRKMYYWKPGKGTSCTSLNTSIGQTMTGKAAYKWAFDAHLLPGYVAWDSNPDKPMPSVGDIYLLYRDHCKPGATDALQKPHLRHCGFILNVPTKPGEFWVTADAGQNNGEREAAFLNRRPWELRVAGEGVEDLVTWRQMVEVYPFTTPKPEVKYPYLGGGAESSGSGLADANRLLGWVDIDSPDLVWEKEAFDAEQTELRKLYRYTEADYLDLGRRIDMMLGLPA